MDCKFFGDTLNICGSVYDSANEQPVDIEISLPDYCPDIGKILKCQAFPKVYSKNFSTARLSAEGSTLIRIIYVDDRDKSIRAYEQEYPFTTEFSVKDIGENPEAFLKCKVDYINCRAVTQRKIDIHGAFTVSAKVYSTQKHDIIADAKGAGIMLRRQLINSNSLMCQSSCQFLVSEASDLPAGMPPIGYILRCEATPSVQELKAISGKLIIRGSVSVKILYAGDYDCNDLQTYETEIPFNQFADVSGLEEENLCDAVLDVLSVKPTLKTDNDGEYRIINVELKMEHNVKAYKNSSLAVICDAYSTDYEISSESKQISVNSLCELKNDTVNHKFTADIQGGISQIIDIWSSCNECISHINGNEAKFISPITVCILAKDQNGEITYIEKNSDLEYTANCAEKFTSAEARFESQSVSYNIIGNNQLEIKLALNTAAKFFKNSSFKVITEITPDEAKPKSCENKPALAIYFGSRGETLWDIAQAHNSSVDSIMAENEVFEEVLTEDRMLLIS